VTADATALAEAQSRKLLDAEQALQLVQLKSKDAESNPFLGNDEHAIRATRIEDINNETTAREALIAALKKCTGK